MRHMTHRLRILLLLLSLPIAPSLAQSATQSHPGPAAVKPAAKLLPFSGTWILDPKRSQLSQRINGESKAIIDYDGKTWHYVHSHQQTPEDEPDQWQTTLVVDSPKYNTTQSEEIVFHSRIIRQGNALVFSEYGATRRGQKMRNTVRYTLEDDGNTMIQSETTVSPLGSQHNLYVLHREGTTSPVK